jgi:beta-glucosidase
MNLFKNYYTDPSRQSIILDPKHREAAKIQALQCPVLLLNKNKILPISSNIGSLAIIGALANDQDNQIGCWAPDGYGKDCITPLTSLKAALTKTKINYAPGYLNATSKDKSLFAEAIAAASAS